ncbi:putative cobalamin 5'-phosphate synthase [Pyrodictium delaneyi]|uniref:Adenosylcobinamide-GDP ribazoletransferase n=1 Tax=Pyrodictium delaneyi TaxID=1273541 RepID=A0A0P0N5H3_9CREN|nr:adenosylcobinamide-GDP ribazoletransferase [Pyrodictium delaneyi]ALL01531.1 putative cobalamin 5'-phosphate synthase [Pyrodictium delaneyi]
MTELLRNLGCLIAFLTRIPVSCHDVREAARGYPLVPLVGLLEGIIVAATMHVAPEPGVAAALALILHLLVTGGLHLDGFADYSDAMGAGARGETAARIMKDPRRGGFALAYTIVLLVAKYAGFEAVWRSPLVVVASYIAAAEAMYTVSALLPAPGYRGLGWLFRNLGVSRRGIAINLVIYASAALATVLLEARRVLAALTAGAAMSLLVARDARLRLGYASGDVLGFAYETVHTAALLVAALLEARL